jgi:hypothetical protein
VTCREDAGGGLGRAKEESRIPQVEMGKVEGRTAELDHQEIAAVDAIANAVATTEAEAATTEAVASCPTTDEVVVREVDVIDASSSPASREDAREVAEEAVKEVSTDVRASEPSEMDVQASSGPGPAPGAKGDMLAPGMEIGVATGPLLFGATSGLEEVAQGAHAARTVEIERSEASPIPRAAAKSASEGENLAAPTGSGASSQSSASQLQKEWVDIAFSIGSGGGHRAQGDILTLAELSKQLSAVKTSLGNASLQFTEAANTIDVSNMFSAFDFFCRLCHCAS